MAALCLRQHAPCALSRVPARSTLEGLRSPWTTSWRFLTTTWETLPSGISSSLCSAASKMNPTAVD